MDRQKVCRIATKAILILCCVGLFLWNSFSSLEKFFSKAATVSKSVDSANKELPYPSISICLTQPFNEKSIKENNIKAEPWIWSSSNTMTNKLAKNESINVNDWSSMIFQVEDVFDLDFDLDDEDYSFGPSKNLNDKDVEIQPIDTFFDGRCFTVSTTATRKAHVGIIIALKYPWHEYSYKNKFKAFIHSDEERINLVNQYWLGQKPKVVEIEPVTLVDLVVYTQEHNELHYDSSGKIKCQGKGWKPFYECYHRIIQTAPNCSLPTTRYINKDIIDRNCTTYGEIKQFQSGFIKSMYKVQDDCPRPCQIRSYELQVRSMYVNNTLSNSTIIWYMHGSSDIDVYTEIRLYDFAAIVAAVGGSLGLFLGFSCLDSILIFINWIFSKE